MSAPRPTAAESKKVAAAPAPVAWQVVEWKHANVGGTGLVLSCFDGHFTLATGPTPWGTGSWGPFPVSSILSVRDLTADDSWGISGTLGRTREVLDAYYPNKKGQYCERWTASDLLRALQNKEWPNAQLNESLRSAIRSAEGGSL